MLVRIITVHLKSPVLWVCAELSVTILQISLYIPLDLVQKALPVFSLSHNVFMYLHVLLLLNKTHVGRSHNRERFASTGALLFYRTARNSIPTPATEEICHVMRFPARSTDHSPQ